jgi:anti-sigma factor RsiW
MKHMSCVSLDDFLAGELAADCRVEFKAHLADCSLCRAEVAEWQALCRTLKAASDELEVPPADLAQRIERAAKVAGQTATENGRTWPVAALIAASLLAAALFSEILRPTLQPDAEQARPKALVAATLPKSGPKAAPTRPSIEIHGKVIGVPIDIGNPNVTVVWLYPEAVGPESQK